MNAKPDSTPSLDLLCMILVAIGFTLNGVILATARRTPLTSARILPWLHAGIALIIVLVTFSINRLVDENFTTVFWGISAIVLFVFGLFAGLRSYRMTGLIGLALFCIPHIFIWDIQDAFYRIIAVLVTALVLFAIAFLYHRFRDHIASFDQIKE